MAQDATVKEISNLSALQDQLQYLLESIQIEETISSQYKNAERVYREFLPLTLYTENLIAHLRQLARFLQELKTSLIMDDNTDRPSSSEQSNQRETLLLQKEALMDDIRQLIENKCGENKIYYENMLKALLK